MSDEIQRYGESRESGLRSHHTHIGEVAFVLHPLVYVVEASDERPWHTLVTSGMSARPMTHRTTSALSAPTWS